MERIRHKRNMAFFEPFGCVRFGRYCDKMYLSRYLFFPMVDWGMDVVLKLLLFSLICLSQGGYNLSSVEESMCACTSSLLGDPCPRLDGPMTPCDR